MIINIFLAVSVTLGYIIWIEFSNLVRPELEWKIGKKNPEVKRVQLTFFSRSVFKYWLIDVGLNMISSFPWFYNSTYTEYHISGLQYKFYVNTIFLTAMVVIRTVHILKCFLQSSDFMTPRAERLTRIFNARSKYSLS